MTPALRVAASNGPVRCVKGSPPVTASHGYIAGSVTMRATTTVAVSLAPRTTPQAIATPGAAKASDRPCTSRGASSPSTTAPGAQASPTSTSEANKTKRPTNKRFFPPGKASSCEYRRPRESGDAATLDQRRWIPAFAGMTKRYAVSSIWKSSISKNGDGVRGKAKQDGCTLRNECAGPLVVTDDLQHFLRAAH